MTTKSYDGNGYQSSSETDSDSACHRQGSLQTPLDCGKAHPLGESYTDHYDDPIADTELFAMERCARLAFSQMQQAVNSPTVTSSCFQASCDSTSSASSQLSIGTSMDSSKPLSFPLLLYKMLSDAPKQGFEHVVSWSPHGRAFQVHDTEAFEQVVMPRYVFDSSARRPSKVMSLTVCR